jgi:hypothetical protein
MGASNSKRDTEAIWNNIKTENMSTTLPDVKGLSKDAKQLLASLNLPQLADTETPFDVDNILNTINSNLSKEDQTKFHDIIEQMSPGITEEVSTSPFMSAEMYQSMINSKTSEDEMIQAGGGYHSRSIKRDDSELNTLTHKYGGKKDSSSTSSITSTSTLEDLDSSSDSELSESIHKKDKKKSARAKMDKKSNKKSKKPHMSESELSGGDELSYVSSSAHTDGDFSDSDVSQSQSHHSVVNENSMVETSVSVNTEDINYVDSD